MKRMIVFVLIMLFVSMSVEAMTYKPIYKGGSICYKLPLKDQNGVMIVPAANDIVTLTLWKTENSTVPLLTMIGVYVAGQSKYNFEFSAETTDTANLTTGTAYWYLEFVNTTTKIDVVMDISSVTIKPLPK